MFKKFGVAAVVGIVAMTAHASCEDIKAGCRKAFDQDLQACNKQDPRSQDNCFKRAHEALANCMHDCK
ncbi:MAG TPA: hypothetical protein VN201_04865 [Roseateles sp.]|nr:hypothetical protein [Roseateles sp.]